MNQNKIELMFSLLSSAIRNIPLDADKKEALNSEDLSEILDVSRKHDISHLLMIGLKQNSVLQNNLRNAEKDIMKALYRYERLKYELDKLVSALEKAEIPFMPLKGSVIRKYYAEPSMRTSCDIDLLIREEDIEKAANLLVEIYGYIRRGKGSHDVSMFSPNKVHVELHYELVEFGWANSSADVLKNVWQTAFLCNGYNYCYEMSDDMFYFYHIAHMAKHFIQGGCGIRPFIDIWLLDNIDSADIAKRNKLLKRSNLLKFAEVARSLSKVWLEGEKHSDITKQMETYILNGGLYGTPENRISLQQQKEGGLFKYTFSKVFIPYDIIKFQYPILQKHRWLTPFMEIRRWFKLIFCGHAKRTMYELKYSSAISQSDAEKTQKFLNDLGL